MQEFQDKLRVMPNELRTAGIVFTERLLDIKPLEIPLQAVKHVLTLQQHSRHSVFMNMLAEVVQDPPCCNVVSEQGEFAFPDFLFAQALCGVAVCKYSHLMT